MADEHHAAPTTADTQGVRRGSAYIQEAFGVSPFELYARHEPDQDRVIWILAGELRDAAHRLDSMHEEFDNHARWIERDLAHAREHPDRINPLGVLQSTGAAVERNAARIELAWDHLQSLARIYKAAFSAAQDHGAAERGFDRGRRTQNEPSQPHEHTPADSSTRPPSRRGVQPVPTVITASPPVTRGRR